MRHTGRISIQRVFRRHVGLINVSRLKHLPGSRSCPTSRAIAARRVRRGTHAAATVGGGARHVTAATCAPPFAASLASAPCYVVACRVVDLGIQFPNLPYMVKTTLLYHTYISKSF